MQALSGAGMCGRLADLPHRVLGCLRRQLLVTLCVRDSLGLALLRCEQNMLLEQLFAILLRGDTEEASRIKDEATSEGRSPSFYECGPAGPGLPPASPPSWSNQDTPKQAETWVPLWGGFSHVSSWFRKHFMFPRRDWPPWGIKSRIQTFGFGSQPGYSLAPSLVQCVPGATCEI